MGWPEGRMKKPLIALSLSLSWLKKKFGSNYFCYLCKFTGHSPWMQNPDCAWIKPVSQKQYPLSQWVLLSNKWHWMSSWHLSPTSEPETQLRFSNDPGLSPRRRGLSWGQWHSPVKRSHTLSLNFIWVYYDKYCVGNCGPTTVHTSHWLWFLL